MRNFLTNMRPESFEDIIAAISLYRPGPMESIPRYIEGKHNPETVRYAAPQLKPILDVTYGCMVYQEQVMQIVRDLAGYSMGRSDLVRRAMSKKKHDVMMREKQNFIYGLESEGIPGAVKNGVPEKAAEKIFDEMTAFASYAFNKSHAAAYGVIAVQTGYLKLHYPVEFMAALMNSVVGNASKIAFYIQTCKKGCIEVLPPDVNRSQEKFSVDGGKIRFGLAAIKNLGHGAIQVLIDERASGGPFRDIYDFCARVVGNAVNKKAVESLIRSGALDALPGNRAQKLGVFERAMDAASKAQKTLAAGQLSLFDTAEIEAPPPPLPDFRPFSLADTLQMEKEVTGIYISGHPLDAYEGALSKLPVNARFLASLAEEGPEAGLAYDQRPVQMGGIVAERKLKATKSGNMMAFVQLEDMYGVTEVLVFPKVFERCGSVLEKDAAVLLSGKLSVREEEEPKLLLDRAQPLAASAPAPHCGPQKKLYLKLSEERRAEALEILAGTPGAIPVVLVDAQTRRGQQAPERYWVGEGYDASALTNLLGGANVVYK